MAYLEKFWGNLEKIWEIWKTLRRHIFQKCHVWSPFYRTYCGKKKLIFGNWRIFLFLIYQSTKKYLTFYTGITKWEIHSHLHSLFFCLCKILFETPFCKEYCGKKTTTTIEKLEEVLVQNMPNKKNRSIFCKKPHG